MQTAGPTDSPHNARCPVCYVHGLLDMEVHGADTTAEAGSQAIDHSRYAATHTGRTLTEEGLHTVCSRQLLCLLPLCSYMDNPTVHTGHTVTAQELAARCKERRCSNGSWLHEYAVYNGTDAGNIMNGCRVLRDRQP